MTVRQKLRDLCKDMWNVPNCLTLLRLALVPVFIVLYQRGLMVWALAVFIIASLTDWADGYIARKYQLITNFGKLMDPLADKLMVLSALACHGFAGVFPWSAILIVAGKELLMVLGGAFLLDKGIVVYANMWGKTATVFFIAALIAGFLRDWITARLGFPLHLVLLWAAVALTLCALCNYAWGAWKQLQALKRK